LWTLVICVQWKQFRCKRQEGKVTEAEAEPDDLTAALALLWGSGRARTRGPKPAYALEQVVDAAIGIADREGLAAVSMQRLADELHFTKMALYRYVPGRSELVALMADRAIGQPPAAAGETARQRLEQWALAVFAGFLRHGWAIEATVGRRVIGPNEAAWMEAGLSALSGLGLTGAERLDALAVLSGHVRAFAQQMAGATGQGSTLERDLIAPLQRGLSGSSERYPVLGAVLAAAQQEGGRQNGLAFGLALILDGLERLVAGRRGE
jgi:AcrR family transcriptional regulator